MIDAAQGLLVLVVTILTALLVVIGLHVLNILREFKRTLEKINKILEDAGTISENIAKPVSDVSSFFKMIGILVDFIKDRKQKGSPRPEIMTAPEGQLEEELFSPKPRRRFFHRKGKKLA